MRFGKWLFCLLLCGLCVLPQDALAADKSPIEPEQAYSSKVHSSACLTAPVIGQLEDGAQIKVLGEEEGFYRIDCYDSEGYIAKSQVRSVFNTDYYVNCDAESGETQRIVRIAMAQVLAARFSLLAMAEAQLGTAYVYAGKAPGGFDCSGFTTYIFLQHGIELHRCADEQLQDGLIVSEENLQPGDLVFFRYAGCPWLASHVGSYVGNRQMIHASTGRGICYDDLDAPCYAEIFVGARRVLHMDAADPLQLSAAAGNAMQARHVKGMRKAP